MLDDPRVSVVVPVQNCAAILAPTLRSALESPLTSVEVLVADDGSTDGCAEIGNGMGDPRITVIRLQPTGVPGRPLNAGLARARAPYVTLLMPGDLLAGQYLASVAAALDEHPDAAIAFGDVQRVDVPTAPVPSDPTATGWQVIPRAALARVALSGFLGTSGITVRKSCIAALGPIDETLTDGGVLDLWLRISHRHGVLYRPQISHTAPCHRDDDARGAPVRLARDRIRVLRDEQARRSARSERRELDPLIALNQVAIAREHRRQARTFRALASLSRAFLADPQLRWVRRGTVRGFGDAEP